MNGPALAVAAAAVGWCARQGRTGNAMMDAECLESRVARGPRRVVHGARRGGRREFRAARREPHRVEYRLSDDVFFFGVVVGSPAVSEIPSRRPPLEKGRVVAVVSVAVVVSIVVSIVVSVVVVVVVVVRRPVFVPFVGVEDRPVHIVYRAPNLRACHLGRLRPGVLDPLPQRRRVHRRGVPRRGVGGVPPVPIGEELDARAERVPNAREPALLDGRVVPPRSVAAIVVDDDDARRAARLGARPSKRREEREREEEPEGEAGAWRACALARGRHGEWSRAAR